MSHSGAKQSRTKNKATRVPVDDERDEPPFYKINSYAELLSELSFILDQPSLALSLFVIGMVFIVAASKQVRFLIDTLERNQLATRPRDGVMSYLLPGIVFLAVLINVFVFVAARSALDRAIASLNKWYNSVEPKAAGKQKSPLTNKSTRR